MGRKVACYFRCSTLDQNTDNQKIEVREYCDRMGWDIVQEYEDEGLSGTLSRAKRPAFNNNDII